VNEKLQNASAAGSSAKRPDLDWSQVRETMTMLCLAVAQIRCTLTDGDSSVNSLVAQFTQILTENIAIRDALAGITPTSDPITVRDSLLVHSDEALRDINQAITNFQFYDRLSQRLDHVAKSLQELTTLISRPDQLYNPNAWAAIQENIRVSYSMESERLMFEHIMQGASIADALEIYRHQFSVEKSRNDTTDDEIELF